MLLSPCLEGLLSNPKFLAAAAVIFIVFAQALREKRKQAPHGRPPMVSYLIPWVGSALQLQRDPDGFLYRMRKKYGDVFTVKICGRVITFVMSPSLMSEVYRNPQKYDFEHIRTLIDINYFRVPASLMKSEITSKIVHPTQHKNLSPTAIIPILESYTGSIWEELESTGSGHVGVSTPLLDFVLPVLHRASGYAFFGRSRLVPESYKPFQDFNGTFHLAFAGIPRFFLRTHIGGLAAMHRLFEEYFDAPHDDAAEMVLETEQILRRHNYDSRTIGIFFIPFLFGLMANAPIAGYWLIVLNLRREGGLQPLTKEVDEAAASWRQKNPGQDIREHLYEFISTAELPLLTSAIQETLRYTTSVMPFRRVTEPVELGGYRFNVDEEIFCMTRAVHFDEEIHENAQEYDPERYMGGKRFQKNGKTITNHSMPWGGGVSMCGGRHFATKELKIFMSFLLMQYTLEVDPESAERPTLPQIGGGVISPVGDLRVIFRTRK